MKSGTDTSSSDLDEACQKVGRFMHDFAEVETEINARIVDILGLKGDAAGLVHSIDFFKKLNMLRTVILDLAPEEEHSEFKTLFISIIKLNDNRQIMAHCAFKPAAENAVQFRRTIAKDGKITAHDPLWTPQMFEESSDKLRDILKRLRRLRPRLDIGFGEHGVTRKKRGRYLYHPTEFIPWR